jgi:hypothetical protein
VDEAGRDALVGRINDQGWDQGCFVPLKDWAFIANAEAPTSSLGERAAQEHGVTSGSIVAHAVTEEQEGVIITTQICDLVADPELEPFCEGMPLVRMAADESLPHPNSTRGFVVNADEHLVVDGTYRLQFEKSLLPEESATQLLDDTGKRLFAAWLGRRASRAPFPDDFVAAVGKTIEWVWNKNRFAKSAVAEHLYLWRAGIYGDNESQVDFLIPYDERAIGADEVKAFVDEFFGEARKRLPVQTQRAREYEATKGSGADIRDYTVAHAAPRPATKVSMRQMLQMPPFNLEHLTYGSQEITGAESHIEWEA